MTQPEMSNDAISEVVRTEPGTGWQAVADAHFDGADSDLAESLAAMEATEFTAPFDWQTVFAGREAELDDPAVVATADLELLRQLMTAHIRIDRFSPGHLDALIANGYWRRCYTRLRIILAERGGPA